MSQTEEVFVPKSDFDALVERMDDGFREMRAKHECMQSDILTIRKNQAHLQNDFLELRREVSHHSDLLGELIKHQGRLEQEVAAGRQENTETRNMVKQILEIVSNK